MMGLLQRAGNILVKPRPEWQKIEQERVAGREITAYVAFVAAAPPLATVAERMVTGGAGSQPLGYVLASNAAWYFVILVNMALTAMVITFVVTPRERSWITRCGLQLASYSFTPLFLVGALISIPRLNWLIYPAMLYSLYLLYLGIRTTRGATPGKAAAYAAGSFFAAAPIVGFVSGAEYLLESFVAGKLFS